MSKSSARCLLTCCWLLGLCKDMHVILPLWALDGVSDYVFFLVFFLFNSSVFPKADLVMRLGEISIWWEVKWVGSCSEVEGREGKQAEAGGEWQQECLGLQRLSIQVVLLQVKNTLHLTALNSSRAINSVAILSKHIFSGHVYWVDQLGRDVSLLLDFAHQGLLMGRL